MEGRTLPFVLMVSSKAGVRAPVGKVRPMVKVAADAEAAERDRAVDGSMGQPCAVIDQLAREGDRRMLAEA